MQSAYLPHHGLTIYVGQSIVIKLASEPGEFSWEGEITYIGECSAACADCCSKIHVELKEHGPGSYCLRDTRVVITSLKINRIGEV